MDNGNGKVVVVYSEMNEADQASVIDMASNALKLQDKSEKIIYFKDLAQFMKNELDTQKKSCNWFRGTWNVIVGKAFGSFVTHETKSISHFFIGSVGFLVWKHG